MPASNVPSGNWLALKKTLSSSHDDKHGRHRKRRKADTTTISDATSEISAGASTSTRSLNGAATVKSTTRFPDSVESLRRMVYGESSYSESHELPGKYISIDCEMVGIAGDPAKRNSTSRDKGDESSLARVSVVNYYGYVLLDTFVRQRERVTDWRTAVSGVRESDMINAKSFSEVQKLVADLLNNRILVGHAVHNDLKTLLLSHPHNLTRDTQILAGRHGTASTSQPPSESANSKDNVTPVKRNKRQALRKLVSEELGIDIQSGEHSSIVDARATMALYRLNKKLWDKGFSAPLHKGQRKKSTTSDASPQINTGKPEISTKRKRSEGDDDDSGSVAMSHAEHSRKFKKQAISSGLSVVVKSHKNGKESKQVKSGTRSHVAGKTTRNSSDKWWNTLM